MYPFTIKKDPLRCRLGQPSPIVMQRDQMPVVIENRRTKRTRQSVGEVLHATFVSEGHQIGIQHDLLRVSIGVLDQTHQFLGVDGRLSQLDYAPVGVGVAFYAYSGPVITTDSRRSSEAIVRSGCELRTLAVSTLRSLCG